MPTPPLNTAHLLQPLDRELMDLLQSLSPAEWEQQTIAKLWTVKDVVAHLLDSNIRVLSIFRDDFYGEKTDAASYDELVIFLNHLNADWVKAMKRVSPQLLIQLHKITGPMFCNYMQSLDPFGVSAFPVAWAGEAESKYWMEIAREYTEKWLHQQQIRDAVNKPGIMTKTFYYPFLDTFMMALPHTYRNVIAVNGTIIKLTVSTDIGGTWFLTRADNTWHLSKNVDAPPATIITIDPDIAWKLFSKSIRPESIKEGITISGNEQLGARALTMVAVMA